MNETEKYAFLHLLQSSLKENRKCISVAIKVQIGTSWSDNNRERLLAWPTKWIKDVSQFPWLHQRQMRGIMTEKIK